MTQLIFPEPTDTPEGHVLDGKYRVDHVLGVGGMGTVAAAHHLQLDTPLAIKFLRPSLLTNQEAVASFMREARAAIQMNNEHVTRVFDVGRLATGAPYIVMELLDGADLGTLLQTQGPFSVETAVDFVLQACEAVAEAHSLGVVHRDLKPANLFCVRRPDGRPIIKVLDFGISKATDRRSASITQELPGEPIGLAGTPRYMSPEQIEASGSIDTRADIWALGVVLFELLTGETPFRGNNLSEVSAEIAGADPTPLASILPNATAGLAAVIETCLAKERDRRYDNVASLALALAPFSPKLARTSSIHRIMEILQVTPPPSLEPGPLPGAAASAADATTEDANKLTVVELAEGAHADHDVAVATATLSPAAPPRRRRAAGVLGALAIAGAVVVLGALGFASLSARRAAATRAAAAGVASVPARTAVVPAPGPVQASAPTASGTAEFAAPLVPIAALPERPMPGLPATSTSASTTASIPTSAPAGALATSALPAAVGPDATAGATIRPSSPRAATTLTDLRVNPRSAKPSRPANVSAASMGSSASIASMRAAAAGGSAPASNAAPRPQATAATAMAMAMAAKTTAVGPSAKVACNPSFEIDELGRKHFKADCVADSAGPRPAAPASDCDPNFEIDELGRKHFKAACFLNAGPAGPAR